MPRTKQQPITKQQRAEINSLFVKMGINSDTIDEIVLHFTRNRTRSMSSYDNHPVTVVEANSIQLFLISLTMVELNQPYKDALTELRILKQQHKINRNQRWNSKNKFRQL